MVSSLIVMAIGFVEITTLPIKWLLAKLLVAVAEYVSPLLSVMLNGIPAECPSISALGVMVTIVASSVATISKEL